MKDRIIKFIESESLSSARFADDIGVQRSTVSHILSGRNNPSFDFIQKILTKYKYLNAEWLIMGTGNMLKTLKQGNLFENVGQELNIPGLTTENTIILNPQEDILNNLPGNKPADETNHSDVNSDKNNNMSIEKIITIYKNKTFDIYFPAE